MNNLVLYLINKSIFRKELLMATRKKQKRKQLRRNNRCFSICIKPLMMLLKGFCVYPP